MPVTVDEKLNNTSFGQNLPEKTSYELTSTELHNSLSGRGCIGSVLAESAELDRRLMQTRIEYPESYALGDIIAADSGTKYRSGSDEGMPYMTVDDYINFCIAEQQKMREAHKDRYDKKDRETEIIRNMRKAPDVHPAAPYEIAVAAVPGEGKFKGRKMTVFNGNEESELDVLNLSESENALAHLGRVYIPAERTVSTGFSSKHVSSGIAAMASVMVLTFLLSIPICFRILTYNETAAIAGLKNDIAAEQAEIDKLELDLAIRNEQEDIERIAIEKYGMVKLDVSSYEILKINRNDSIVNEEKSNKKEGTVPALLNALGIRIGK